ncbi:uncharacterized protein V1516DRAFT_684669 [Lipomyces oligophaga]|uniref:uncharacterized protein n=1 Tax=Lipomyces oligophaga TaxID=45792 RepID=UPI0034CDCEBE
MSSRESSVPKTGNSPSLNAEPVFDRAEPSSHTSISAHSPMSSQTVVKTDVKYESSAVPNASENLRPQENNSSEPLQRKLSVSEPDPVPSARSDAGQHTSLPATTVQPIQDNSQQQQPPQESYRQYGYQQAAAPPSQQPGSALLPQPTLSPSYNQQSLPPHASPLHALSAPHPVTAQVSANQSTQDRQYPSHYPPQYTSTNAGSTIYGNSPTPYPPPSQSAFPSAPGPSPAAAYPGTSYLQGHRPQSAGAVPQSAFPPHLPAPAGPPQYPYQYPPQEGGRFPIPPSAPSATRLPPISQIAQGSNPSSALPHDVAGPLTTYSQYSQVQQPIYAAPHPEHYPMYNGQPQPTPQTSHPQQMPLPPHPSTGYYQYRDPVQEQVQNAQQHSQYPAYIDPTLGSQQAAAYRDLAYRESVYRDQQPYVDSRCEHLNNYPPQSNNGSQASMAPITVDSQSRFVQHQQSAQQASAQQHQQEHQQSAEQNPTQPANSTTAAQGHQRGRASRNPVGRPPTITLDVGPQPAAPIHSETRTAIQILLGDEKRFECPECSRKFRRREHLKRHISTLHQRDKPYACEFCNRRFSRGDNLLQHSRMRHRGHV